MSDDFVGPMRIGIDWVLWHASAPGRVETMEDFA
jgi:hypothetical protein